jgi:hypothetical protein
MPDACMKKVLRKRLEGLERPPNVIPFRRPDPAVEYASDMLVEAAVQYCETICGGCDLAQRWREAARI